MAAHARSLGTLPDGNESTAETQTPKRDESEPRPAGRRAADGGLHLDDEARTVNGNQDAPRALPNGADLPGTLPRDDEACCRTVCVLRYLPQKKDDERSVWNRPGGGGWGPSPWVQGGDRLFHRKPLIYIPSE